MPQKKLTSDYLVCSTAKASVTFFPPGRFAIAVCEECAKYTKVVLVALFVCVFGGSGDRKIRVHGRQTARVRAYPEISVDSCGSWCGFTHVLEYWNMT